MTTTPQEDAVASQALSHASAIAEAGTQLFTLGAVLGSDRVAGRTSYGYGDDRVVALAVAAEIGGDLGLSSVQLLSEGRAYSAYALLRQVIEVEYLIWAFGSSDQQARDWLNAEPRQLRDLFRPSSLRRRAAPEFDSDEYVRHCNTGGHPSPSARSLLQNHAMATPIADLWVDIRLHLWRVCGRLESACRGLRSAGAIVPEFACAAGITGSRHVVGPPE